MALVNFVISEFGPAADADTFYEEHPELSQTKTLRLFYSRKRIMSAEAKPRFCEPDLTPFPVNDNYSPNDKASDNIVSVEDQ